MKFLIIQTAFIGDVILATPLIEKIHRFFPKAETDFLLRSGNESLLIGNPHVSDVIIWDKKQNKYKNLWKVIKVIRRKGYDYEINLHRFLSTGVITVTSGAGKTIGFDKSPLSSTYDIKIKHRFTEGIHEVDRNLELIGELTDDSYEKPKLYPSEDDYKFVEPFKTRDYICIAPASVWFTKQFPTEKWIEFMKLVNEKTDVNLLGSEDDHDICGKIILESGHPECRNLAGELSLLQTAALMKDARMNFVNDSAPLHLASAMNAPVTAVFCSTIPGYGFGPLSDNSIIVETKMDMDCRPCGLHGLKDCPKEHFNCANSIEINELANIANG